MLLDLRTSSRSFSQSQDSLQISADSSTSSISSNEDEISGLSPSLVPTPTLFVTNLPTLLFSDAKDLYPLFCPFGLIKKLSVTEKFPNATTSVILEYGSAEVAQEAKETLHGQCYAGHQIATCYIRTKSSLLDLVSVSNAAYYNGNARPALNPVAHQSSSLLRHPGSYYNTPYPQHFNKEPQHYFQNVPLRAPPFVSPVNYRQHNDCKWSSPRWSNLQEIVPGGIVLLATCLNTAIVCMIRLSSGVIAPPK